MKISDKKFREIIIGILVILVPLYVLYYCLKDRMENFDTMDGKKKVSMKFPPPNGVANDLKTTMRGSDDFDGAPNDELLNQLNPKMPVHKVDGLAKKPDEKNKILNQQINKQVLMKTSKAPTTQITKDDFKNTKTPQSLKGKCGFYSECPTGYYSLGMISGQNMQCGANKSGQQIKQAKFVAEIDGGIIKTVNVMDGGSGYNPQRKYTLKVIGTGKNANLEAIIDDSGKVQVVNVISGGSGYTSTPKVVIEDGSGSGTNSQCNFCCKE